MSHIERKKIKGRYYIYLYQSYRDKNGSVKKKMIEYLGPESNQSIQIYKTKRMGRLG
ncbi:MAG: hypothetical protein KAU03_04680 [Candidatus Altiarchaeales archaeon]|nr:hypothetical protein [Candidatus Altiarchaeales archaeon]